MAKENTPEEMASLTNKDETMIEMQDTSTITSPEHSDDEDDIVDFEEYEYTSKFKWLSSLIKHLAFAFVVGLILMVPVIVLTTAGNVDFMKALNGTRDKGTNMYAYNSVAAFTCAASLVVITTIVSYIISSIPRIILFLVKLIAVSKTELVKQYLEFYIALMTTIKVVISVSIAFGLWRLTFPKSIIDDFKSDDYRPTAVFYRIFLIAFLATLIIAIEKVLIQIIAVRFHRTAYRHRLNDAAYSSYVLDRLSKARRKYGSGSNPRKSRLLGPAGSTEGSSFNLVTMGKAKKELYHTPSGTAYEFPQKEANKAQPKDIYENINKRAFEGRFEDDKDLNSKAEARRVAAKIFGSLQNQRRYLVLEDFYPYFPKPDDAKKAFAYFDKDGNGDISRREMRDQISLIYKERKDLGLALSDTSQAVGKLDKILVFIFSIISCFVASLVFGKDLYASLIPFGTFFLGLSFIFGESAKQLFQSIIFLFVMHPYDAGDRVYIDKENMVVQKVGLLGTKFIHSNGQETYITHTILVNKIIYNIRRSTSQAEQIDFQLDFDTPKEKIIALKDRLNQYLVNEESREFYSDPLLAISELVDCNKLNMFVWLEHKGNWEDGGRRWARKTRFMIALREICIELGLGYTLLPQRIEHLNLPPYPGQSQNISRPGNFSSGSPVAFEM